MKKSEILLDIDDVVCFLGFLKAVNDFLGTSYEIDDFTDYFIDEAIVPKDQFDDFNKFVSSRNLYDDAIILPNAVSTLESLNELYDIYPCSSCINPFNLADSGKLFKNKYDYLFDILPFISPEHYIFTSSKQLFKAAIKIDDRLSNLNGCVDTKILFPSYHNKNITTYDLEKINAIRAGYDWRTGWDEVKNILVDDYGRPKIKSKK